MKPAVIWMWLVTLPNGEDRVVPLLGHNFSFLWESKHVEMFRPIAERWAELHAPGLPLRLAKMTEVT